MAGYRDADRFIECCRQCRNYGRSWACPPFDYDTEAMLGQWQNALIVICRIGLPECDNPMAEGLRLLRLARVDLEKRLLELEREHGGLAFGFSGECLHCRQCVRCDGMKCRHPELVRPALEAYGFDVGKTVSDLFGFRLQWATKDALPEYLTLVGALFHNNETGKIIF